MANKEEPNRRLWLYRFTDEALNLGFDGIAYSFAELTRVVWHDAYLVRVMILYHNPILSSLPQFSVRTAGLQSRNSQSSDSCKQLQLFRYRQRDRKPNGLVVD